MRFTITRGIPMKHAVAFTLAATAALTVASANAWWGPMGGGYPGAMNYGAPAWGDGWGDMFGDVDTSFRTTGWGRGRGTGYTYPQGYGYGYPGYYGYGYGAPAAPYGRAPYGAPVAPMAPPAAPAGQ